MNYNKENASKKKDSVNQNKTKKKKQRNVKALKITLIIILAIIIIAIGVACAFIKSIVDQAPNISEINVAPSQLATVVYDCNGNETTRLIQAGSNRTYVSLDQIPDSVQKAFIAIEDERFYSHNGVDIQGIFRAFFTGLTKFSFSEGASTITQQLIKNNVLTNWTNEATFMDSLKRKIQEQYLAIQIEKDLSKETILEYYLNTINLGQNCLGVQTAAKRYFDKDVSELTISEASVIAAITQNPTANNPISHPDKNKQRRDKALNNMLKLNYISQAQYNDAIDDDVYSRVLANSPMSTSLSTTSYFVDELVDQVCKALCEEKGYSETYAYNLIYSGGLQIYSTQDPSIQAICDEECNKDSNYPARIDWDLSYRLTVKKASGAITNYSEKDILNYFKESNSKYKTLYKSKEQAQADIQSFKEYILKEGDSIPENGEVIYYIPQPQTSVTVMDQYTGEVKALVGGRGEKVGNMTLNRATQTTKQPGSCFKVLASFAPALDTCGKTLASVYEDAPFSYTNGRPVNNWWGDSYRGFSSIRDGIRDSMNIIAVRCITDITPQLAFDYLKNFGFTTLVDHKTLDDGTIISDIGQPTALGGVSMGIKNIEITAAYAAIANAGTYTKPRLFTKILDAQGKMLIDNQPQTKRVLKETTAYLLTSAMQDVVTSGTGTGAAIPNSVSAGKTGTTTDDYDIWHCAYTPYYTCSVWAGYDVNTSLPNGSFHLGIWKNIMQRVHESLPAKDFKQPAGIVSATICSKCGKLAVAELCDKDPRSVVKTEIFDKDNVPTETCSCHVAVNICEETGKPAAKYCAKVIQKIFQVYPEGATKGSADDEYAMPEGFMDDSCIIHMNPPAPDHGPDENNPNKTNQAGHTNDTTGNHGGTTGSNSHSGDNGQNNNSTPTPPAADGDSEQEDSQSPAP